MQLTCKNTLTVENLAVCCYCIQSGQMISRQLAVLQYQDWQVNVNKHCLFVGCQDLDFYIPCNTWYNGRISLPTLVVFVG